MADSASKTEQLLQQIGEQFRQLRLAHNVSQEDLAVDSGVGLSTLKRLERGQGCNLAALVQLMVALDYDTELQGLMAQLAGEVPMGGSGTTKSRRRASSPRRPTE